MKTILIPVDFSDTSTNALKYATELIKDIPVENIVLLKSFYKSVYEQLLPSADFIQLSTEDICLERNEINEQLRILTDTLVKKCNPSIRIQTVISELPLLRAIHQLIAEKKPDLLIVGSDNCVIQQKESYIGRHVIGIAKTSPVPVLIVPADASYRKIERALVPCDFSAVSRLSLLQGKNNPIDWAHPKLMVLNIDPQRKHLKLENDHITALKDQLAGYEFEIYYTGDEKVVDGILKFARANDVQLITALPGKYSFFYKFTHRSTTDALAQDSNHPILILK